MPWRLKFLVLTGPKSQDEMDEALSALEKGPLSEGELERMRLIGDHVYGAAKPNFADKGDAPAPA